jgi:hypothetical protein
MRKAEKFLRQSGYTVYMPDLNPRPPKYVSISRKTISLQFSQLLQWDHDSSLTQPMYNFAVMITLLAAKYLLFEKRYNPDVTQ